MSRVIADVVQVTEELQALAAQLRATGDPAERAVIAHQAWSLTQHTVGPAFATERRAAVRQLRAEGLSLKDCAGLLGVTDSRVSQIVK